MTYDSRSRSRADPRLQTLGDIRSYSRLIICLQISPNSNRRKAPWCSVFFFFFFFVIRAVGLDDDRIFSIWIEKYWLGKYRNAFNGEPDRNKQWMYLLIQYPGSNIIEILFKVISRRGIIQTTMSIDSSETELRLFFNTVTYPLW